MRFCWMYSRISESHEFKYERMIQKINTIITHRGRMMKDISLMNFVNFGFRIDIIDIDNETNPFHMKMKDIGSFSMEKSIIILN